MDIDSDNFLTKKDAVVDLIALMFGLVRCAGWGETWHFEMSDLGFSDSEKALVEQEER